MRRWAAVWLWALLAAACGGGEAAAPVERWTLSVEGRPPTPVHLPADFRDILPARDVVYTLTTTIEVPPALRGRDLTLAIPHFPGVVTLHANGILVEDQEWSITDRHRTRGPHAWRIPGVHTQTDRLDLVLTVEHRWYGTVMLNTVPRLSAGTRGDPRHQFIARFNDWSATVAAIGLLVIAAVYFIVFLVARKRPQYGWVSLQLATAAFYPGSLALGVLQPLLGEHEMAVNSIAVVVASAVSPYFTHAHFRLGRPPRFFPWSIPVALVTTLILYDDHRGALYCAPVYSAIILGNFGYQVYVYARLLRQRPVPRNALLYLIAWAILGLATVPDLFMYLGLGELLGGLHLGGFGMTVFAFILATGLGREHIHSLQAADALNVELRRQIGERSRELAEALARLQHQKRRTPLTVGDVVEGRYRVLRSLGAGAMGKVYEVERLSDGGRFALKVISGNATSETMARFAREAQVAAQLDHPNLVAIVDVDVAKTGELYLVMELVTGANLEEQRARYGDHRWALRVARQIAEGLAAIHGKGIIHRDLKPANVLVSGDEVSPRVKIADFGIASLAGATADTDTALQDTAALSADATAPALTQDGALLGTPLYMAPELARGARAGAAAADVWAFGVLAHELFTKKLPFAEPPVVSRMKGRSKMATLQPAAARADLPEKIGKLLDRCLALDPADRPTAEEIAALLGTLDGRREVAEA